MVATPRAIIITVEEPCVTMQTETNSGMTGRKRRLAHLSVEEKIHRKKLKNRVAAQTSRDRKKARMDELENTVSLLNEQAEELSTECTTLRHRNEALTVENTSLKRQLQEAQATTAALLESLRNTTCGCGRPTQTVASTNSQAVASDAPLNLPRPAESSALPLLKGLSGHQAASLRILQMLLTAAFLLSRNCSQTSGQRTSQTCATWSALRRACSKMHLSSLDGRYDTELGGVGQVVGKTPENVESCGVALADSSKANIAISELETPSITTFQQACSNTSNSMPKNVMAACNEEVMLHTEEKSEGFCLETSENPRESLSEFLMLPEPRMQISTEPMECITIIIPSQDEGDDCVFLGEAIQEVSTSSCKDEPLSPESNVAETITSDCGYESLDSPHSEISSSDMMAEMWNESFTELFPILA